MLPLLPLCLANAVCVAARAVPHSQVCEWALSLNLDASPFWDYGINGAVLVTLSDDDFRVRRYLLPCVNALLTAVTARVAVVSRQNLLGLDEVQVSRLRHALRDVTEVEEGHPSGAAKPAFRPNTGTMPVAHVPPLRKAARAGEAPTQARGNLDALSPELVAKLTDDDLATAFGLSQDDIKAVRARPRGNTPAATTDGEPTNADKPSTERVVAQVTSSDQQSQRPADAAPSRAAAASTVAAADSSKKSALCAAKSAARGALFADDDADVDADVFAPKAASAAKPQIASQAQSAPPETAAETSSAPPSRVEKKPLIGDDDDDDEPSFAPKTHAKHASAEKPAKKPLFDDDDDNDRTLFPQKQATAPLPQQAAAPAPIAKPARDSKPLFDDDDGDEGSWPVSSKSKPSVVPLPAQQAPHQHAQRAGILDIGAGIGETEDDAAERARAVQTSEAVKAEISAQLDELRKAAFDAEVDNFEVAFPALEQKLASLEAKATSTSSSAPLDGGTSSSPARAAAGSGLLFADDPAQDESVQRVESLLSTLNLLQKPVAIQPAAGTMRGSSIFDEAPPPPSSEAVFAPAAEPASAAAVKSHAKRVSLFDDSDDEDDPPAAPPAPEAATAIHTSDAVAREFGNTKASGVSIQVEHVQEEAAADATATQIAPMSLQQAPGGLKTAHDTEEYVNMAATQEVASHVEQGEAPADTRALPAEDAHKHDDALRPLVVPEDKLIETMAVLSALEDSAALNSANLPGVPEAAEAEGSVTVQLDAVIPASTDTAAAAPATVPGPAAPAQTVAPVRAPPAGGRVAALAAAFSSGGGDPVPVPKPATSTRSPPTAAPHPQPAAPATEERAPAASSSVVESVASGSVPDVKRPAPPARGPRRLIGRTTG